MSVHDAMTKLIWKMAMGCIVNKKALFNLAVSSHERNMTLAIIRVKVLYSTFILAGNEV